MVGNIQRLMALNKKLVGKLEVFIFVNAPVELPLWAIKAMQPKTESCCQECGHAEKKCKM